MTESTQPTRESVVLDLITPRKSGWQIVLEAGKQRTGTATSVFHAGQTAVWRVVHKEGEPLPHVQLQVGEMVRRVDDVSYRGVIDALTALFDAHAAPDTVAPTLDDKAVLAMLPSQLRNFILSTQGPSCVEADQQWQFNLAASDEAANELSGVVKFLRYPQKAVREEDEVEELRVPELSFVVVLDEYTRKGELRKRLRLIVGGCDPVTVKSVDDAIEVAYAEFDLHVPKQAQHLLVFDNEEIEFYAFHAGTRISKLVLAAHNQYAQGVSAQDDEDDEDQGLDEPNASTAGVDALVEAFYDADGNCRYAANRVKVNKLPHRGFTEVTLAGVAG